MLAALPMPPDPEGRILHGSADNEDAVIVKAPPAGMALVQTVDILGPIGNDARLFGQTAAANALSDVYAMGGIPWSVMNVAAFPSPEVISGYTASAPELAGMISGGGLLSMVSVVGMMCLTSSFSRLLQETGLLKKATDLVERVAEKTTGFAAILLTAVLTAMISCSQMLAILLTEQLCRGLAEDPAQFANDLEDTTVIVAPLFPWSMAVAVPLATIGVPDGALLLACYLYLLPVWNYATAIHHHRKK